MTPPILNHDFVTASGATPQSWLYILHGIFGSGRNWASIARRLVRARPEWGAVLVDLREHGDSRGFAPPHTVEAAAGDLRRLVESIDRPMSALLGHSFGGKVGLEYARITPELPELWVVDSAPAPRAPEGSAVRMLEIVRAQPETFATRQALIDSLQAARVTLPIAQWMATNLVGDPEGGYRWRFDLDAVSALLDDFFVRDYRPLVGDAARTTRIHFIRALKSDILAGDSLAELERISAGLPTVRIHPVEGGHWVNADNPDALHALLETHLGE